MDKIFHGNTAENLELSYSRILKKKKINRVNDQVFGFNKKKKWSYDKMLVSARSTVYFVSQIRIINKTG